jgi:hypothetical protein
MALEGPQLRYVRVDGVDATEDLLERALRLAREVEDLLEQAPSTPTAQTHSTRIAHAMAASLVDELEAVARGTKKKSGVA